MEQCFGLSQEMFNFYGFCPTEPGTRQPTHSIVIGEIDPFYGGFQALLRLIHMIQFVMGHGQKQPIPARRGKTFADSFRSAIAAAYLPAR